MKFSITTAAAVLLLAGAESVAAQQPVPRDTAKTMDQVIESSGIVPAAEALAASVTPELEHALTQLARSLALVAARIAEDPELRASAARAGSGMAEVAEAAVTEHAITLQEALRQLADRLDEIAARSR